jgi:hypothetical protein
MYTIHKTPRGNSISKNTDDGTLVFIPFDEGNTDYQAYLDWVAEGNTAEEWSAE